MKASLFGILVSLAAVFRLAAPGFAQVAPTEIVNAELKAAEQAYLPQLAAVNQAIGVTSFPFRFVPSRYAGLDPKEQAGADTRGLEFVHFHERLVLKLTGNYNAAFSADKLTPNQRAARVFDDVIVPALRLLPAHFSRGDRFDAFGFEIAYHTRTRSHGFDFEGKEILALVMDKDDALAFTGPSFKRQEALNRSEIFLNGKPFGLIPGERDALDVETLTRSLRAKPAAENRIESSARTIDPVARGAKEQPARPAVAQAPANQPPLRASAPVVIPAAKEPPSTTPPAGPDVDAIQKKYQPELDALAKVGAEKHHFVDYAPPSFVVVRNRLSLQFTMKNPDVFDKDATSIYKRAAQSFDLFLAPRLKPILDKVPGDAELGGLDVTVINQLATKGGSSSESLEFVFPLPALRQFVDAEITNQDLINQSLVLVNGVRIALNLQLVE